MERYNFICSLEWHIPLVDYSSWWGFKYLSVDGMRLRPQPNLIMPCFSSTPSTKLTEISGKPLKYANELRRKPCSWRSRPWWLPFCFGNFSLDFQNSSAAGTNPLPGLFRSAWLGMGVISCGRVRGWGGAALPQWQLWAMLMGQLHMFPKWLKSWVQTQWKVVSVCCSSAQDF